MAKGILLTEDLDILVKDGSFVVGEAELSETAVILGLNRGNHKMDPLLGPNLITTIRSVNGKNKAVALVKKHLARDGKSYEQLKNKLRINAE